MAAAAAAAAAVVVVVLRDSFRAALFRYAVYPVAAEAIPASNQRSI